MYLNYNDSNMSVFILYELLLYFIFKNLCKILLEVIKFEILIFI